MTLLTYIYGIWVTLIFMHSSFSHTPRFKMSSGRATWGNGVHSPSQILSCLLIPLPSQILRKKENSKKWTLRKITKLKFHPNEANKRGKLMILSKGLHLLTLICLISYVYLNLQNFLPPPTSPVLAPLPQWKWDVGAATEMSLTELRCT